MNDPEREALLNAVRQAPDDDLPRLVLADWLEENGEPLWAEFIRGQIESARLPVGHPDREIDDVEARSGSPAQLLGFPFRVTHHRGFIASATMGVSEYLEWADRLGPYAPQLDMEFLLRPSDPRQPDFDPGITGYYPEPGDYDYWSAETCDRLAQCPWLSTWTGVNLTGIRLNPAGFDRLIRSPYLGGLRSLDVSHCSLSLTLTAVSPSLFPRLRSLRANYTIPTDLQITGISDDWLSIILDEHGFPDLEELEFAGNGLNGTGLISPNSFPKLRRLVLDGNTLSVENLQSLGTQYRFPGLREVSLQNCQIEPGMATWLANSPGFARWTGLNLARNSIGNSGLRAIAESPLSQNLEDLDVSDCFATTPGLLAVIQSPWLSSLRRLQLHGNDSTRPVVDALLERESLPALEELSLTIPRDLPNRLRLEQRLRKRFGHHVTIEDGSLYL